MSLYQNLEQMKFAKYLQSKGISDTRFKAVGYGPNKPVDTNDTDAGRANNRRTEFEILTQ